MPLLRGRNKPTVRYPLRFAHEYLKSPLAAPVYPINVTEGIVDFGMMGNDTYGDCGTAGEVHLEMTTAKAAGTIGPDPTSPLAVQRYVSYTGAEQPPGPGVDLASYLLWLCQQGFIKAFAPVDVTVRDTMEALMGAGFGLYVGVNLPDNANDQFSNGRPWDLDGLTPDPEDGHCILWVGSVSPTGLHTFVTWGQVQAATEAWVQACLDEAFLVVTTEEQLAAFDPALLADVAALGGTSRQPAPPAPPEPPEGPQ